MSNKKTERITPIIRNKTTNIYEKENNKHLQHKKFKYEPIKKLGKLATKVKLFLKAHFPKRIWPVPRQNRKGQRF